MKWRHVTPSGAPAAKPPGIFSELYDIRIKLDNDAVIQLPALQRLRCLCGPAWRQGSSVHDTVYRTDRNDPGIKGSGTLIGMFKEEQDAWRATQCVNLFPDLVRALTALLGTAPDPEPDPGSPRIGGTCLACQETVGPTDDMHVIELADVIGVDLDSKVYCPACFVTTAVEQLTKKGPP